MKRFDFAFGIATFGIAFFAVVFCLLPTSQTFAQKKPLKVYILAGQSNMQGHAHVRTLAHLAEDPKTVPMLKHIQDENGKPVACPDVWISYLSSTGVKTGNLTAGFGANEEKLGPELMFGITMQQAVDEPILVIKTAWGGKSVHTDFRSPSAGPFVFDEKQLEQFKKQGKDIEAVKSERAKATGHYYRLMLEHIQSVLADIKQVYPNYDAEAGYELKGFVWFQGWNDMVDRGVYPNRDKPDGYDQYTVVLSHMIRDLRKALAAPKLPVVIGVMGVNGPTSEYGPSQKRYQAVHQNFRDAMAAVSDQAEFKGNVINVLTENCWDAELSELKARQNKVNQALKKFRKENEPTRSEVNAQRKKLMDEAFSAEEIATLQNGISNAEFHYLGSAKIMAQIGKRFAEALVEEER